MQGEIVKCPNCNGKGHVLWGAMVVVTVLTGLLAPLALLDRNNPDGITRERCARCKGKGFVRVTIE